MFNLLHTIVLRQQIGRAAATYGSTHEAHNVAGQRPCCLNTSATVQLSVFEELLVTSEAFWNGQWRKPRMSGNAPAFQIVAHADA
ncbi:hypothetical protein SVAN01_07609 [Stagonosporopsis vannaccii]|nr:hypothetical protein SVAN01_07609 [Stagonosporopsis vannaccii]